MAKSVYITGTGPGSGKSVVVLGVMELLAGHGRKVGFFRPLVGDAAVPDRLTALLASRYGSAVALESAFGAASDVARDLLTRGQEEELQARILESYRRLADRCDFVVCAGTDYRALHTAMEFEFNVEVARNLGAPLLAVIAGQGRTAEEIDGAVRVLAETLRRRSVTSWRRSSTGSSPPPRPRHPRCSGREKPGKRRRSSCPPTRSSTSSRSARSRRRSARRCCTVTRSGLTGKSCTIRWPRWSCPISSIESRRAAWSSRPATAPTS